MEDPDKSESVNTSALVDTAKSVDPDVRVAKQILASEVLCILAMLLVWASIDPNHAHVALVGGLVVLVPHVVFFRWMLTAESAGTTAFFAMVRSFVVIGALIAACVTFSTQLLPLLTTAAMAFFVPICISMFALAKPSGINELRAVLGTRNVKRKEVS